MSSWEQAEETIRRMTGGYITAGSGNKGQRGDVRVNGYYIEVKYTDKEDFNLQRAWFTTLEKEFTKSNLDVILCLFFGIRGYCYMLEESNMDVVEDWKYKTLKEEALPEQIYTSKYIWKQYPLDMLTELKDD